MALTSPSNGHIRQEWRSVVIEMDRRRRKPSMLGRKSNEFSFTVDGWSRAKLAVTWPAETWPRMCQQDQYQKRKWFHASDVVTNFPFRALLDGDHWWRAEGGTKSHRQRRILVESFTQFPENYQLKKSLHKGQGHRRRIWAGNLTRSIQDQDFLPVSNSFFNFWFRTYSNVTLCFTTKNKALEKENAT